MITPGLIKSGLTGAAGLACASALAIKTAYQRRPKPNKDTFGSARFMTEAEAKQSGLWASTQPPDADGVYIGGWKDRRGTIHYLRDISNGHVLICGPTRSGKGISCILPTLLSWRGSALVNDEKGELWAQTAPWRARHAGRVIKWEPGAANGSASWNPLAEIRLLTPHEVADAQNIALMLIDVHGSGLDRLDHWQKAAFQILSGCVLHECYTARAAGRNASLADLASRFADPGSKPSALFEAMRDNTHRNGSPHSMVAAAGRAQLDRSEREQSGVTSTLLTHLMLFADEIVCANTSISDFKLDDLADGEKPTSIFVITRSADAIRLRPLVRLFLTMAAKHLMHPELAYKDGQPVSPHRHKTLVLLDEFPALGKLDEIESALARCASWGIKFLIAIQDLSQLTGIYGQAQSIIANTHIRAFFPTNDLATAKLLSESTGTRTEPTPHITVMGRRFGILSQVTKSIHETSRPLLTPGEILTMRPAVKDKDGRITRGGEMLIFAMGQPPMRAVQLLYFEDPEFVRRAQIAAP